MGRFWWQTVESVIRLMALNNEIDIPEKIEENESSRLTQFTQVASHTQCDSLWGQLSLARLHKWYGKRSIYNSKEKKNVNSLSWWKSNATTTTAAAMNKTTGSDIKWFRYCTCHLLYSSLLQTIWISIAPHQHIFRRGGITAKPHLKSQLKLTFKLINFRYLIVICSQQFGARCLMHSLVKTELTLLWVEATPSTERLGIETERKQYRIHGNIFSLNDNQLEVLDVRVYHPHWSL